jgi:hypothetical protein
MARRDADNPLAEGVYAACAVHDEEIAAVASGQNQPFLPKCIPETPAAIGTLETIPNAFARSMNVHAQPPRLLVFGAGWREMNGTMTLIRDAC